MGDMEVHTEVIRLMARQAWEAVKVISFVVIFFAAVGLFGMLIIMRPVAAMAVIVLLALLYWYASAYRRAKRIRDLRNETGGTCG